MAFLCPITGVHVLNIGSGQRTTVLEVAKQINAHFGSRSDVQITGAFREGDIRHGFADLTRSRAVLGYGPTWKFCAGLKKFLKWVEESEPTTIGYEASLDEMRDRGIFRG
jgi:dTDP-L-rhamnose 4-epimerase